MKEFIEGYWRNVNNPATDIYSFPVANADKFPNQD